PGDWTVVRGWWERLVRPTGAADAQQYAPERVLSIGTDPAPALLQTGEECVTLVVQNRRGNALTADLALRGDKFTADPAMVPITEAARDRPFRVAVTLRGPETSTAGYIDAAVDGKVLTDRVRLPVVRIA